jgi:hypothetical protein
MKASREKSLPPRSLEGGIGLLGLLLVTVLIGWLLLSQLKPEQTQNRVQQSTGQAEDGIAQQALQQALQSSRSLIIPGETNSFNSQDLAQAEATFQAADASTQAGPQSSPRAVYAQLEGDILTLCNASQSGRSFCLRDQNSLQTRSQATGSIAQALQADFKANWDAGVSESPSAPNSLEGFEVPQTPQSDIP